MSGSALVIELNADLGEGCGRWSPKFTYVKPHGALNDVAYTDSAQAAAIATAIDDYDPTPPLVAPPRTEP